MTIADGGILFAACVLAFVLGYVIGVIRVSRFVTKQLTEVQVNMGNIEKYSHELRQIYARLEKENHGRDNDVTTAV
jgi:proteasome assembly chaperone (PAC2) family protein